MLEIDLWRKYIFFPERELWVWPEDYGIKYKEVCFPAADGVPLYGWWMPRGKFTLLFAHGNGGNISHRVDIAAKFHDEGFSIFLFDYRGYGKSEGKPNEKGTYKDAEGALRYLHGKLSIPLSRIVPIGESMGGAIVLKLCISYNFRAVVLISPSLSLSRVLSNLYPNLPLHEKFAGAYDSSKKISKVHSPILIVHGDTDELVPFTHGQELFQCANPPKLFYRVREAGHNDIYEVGGKTLFDRIKTFIHNPRAVCSKTPVPNRFRI
jgi:fermentation-respiration switch protein FrsA (DUF1100 family)